ncbi:OmpA family protein [Shewanella gelidii]|uniref:Porin n=1 Tax=Shewanella gelidii TaxID=1642821 RepID=A0A917JHH3_9GAMM|nr:OmpA family protein [Shewanella gelidii]MCL1096631.1 OmpA family protein [Shewanella gelidii]GGI68989.1 porin [Shewanella gelidii]
MMNKTLKIALLASILPFAAHAEQELSPWYVGAGLGLNNYEPNCDQKTMKVCGEDEPYAFDVFGGYLLNENIGIELGYRNLGKTEWVDYSNAMNDVGVKGVSIGLNSFWPVAERWLFTVEAGALNYLISNNKQYGSEYYSDNDVSPYFGAGIAYKLTEKLNLAAKYRRYENLDEDKWNTLDLESNYYGLELSYRFGEVAKPAPVAAAPVVAEPVDSDGDGVMDDMDRCQGTPSNHQVDKYGCSIYVDKVEKIQIAAKFDNNSSVVKTASYSEIERLADFMNKYPNSKVAISGHASNVGSASYNLTLSEKRANAVAKILVERYGISQSRVTAKGYGVTMPLIEGSSAEANAANRRIEGLVTGSEKKPLLK